MNTAKIVIGLGYGDEGKGITTDFLSNKNNQIVVRFSGGQQAGHTVIKNNIKHIHSSFGSGTLNGIPSYFTEDCTFHPTYIINECKILNSNGIIPRLFIHPLAKMTTPFDVIANKTDNKNLSDGTCGMGVGKTMKRCIESPYKLYAIDLLHLPSLYIKLKNIAKYYGIDYEDPSVRNQIEYYLECIDLLINSEYLSFKIEDYNYLITYDNLVFEGSQGILLDMDHGIFPHVTYANTTSKNAIKICELLGITNIETYYVTRCYSTRHGSGPFKEKNIKLINTKEEINKFDKYQKEFKISEIDYNLLNYSLNIDKIYNYYLNYNLVITCLDQRPEFKFEMDKLDTNFNSIWGSYSAISGNFKKLK